MHDDVKFDLLGLRGDIRVTSTGHIFVHRYAKADRPDAIILLTRGDIEKMREAVALADEKWAESLAAGF